MTPGVLTVWIVLAVIFGFIGTAIEKGKGRSAEGWWLGFLLGIIGVIIVACMSATEEHKVQEAQRQYAIQAEAARRAGYQYPPQPYAPYVPPGQEPYPQQPYAAYPPPGQYQQQQAPGQWQQPPPGAWEQQPPPGSWEQQPPATSPGQQQRPASGWREQHPFRGRGDRRAWSSPGRRAGPAARLAAADRAGGRHSGRVREHTRR
jgi:uncharacterized membrane protein YeaQ/YmgE (transglycosylase-associated protein family)